MYRTTYRFFPLSVERFIYIRFCDEEALGAEALAVYYYRDSARTYAPCNYLASCLFSAE